MSRAAVFVGFALALLAYNVVTARADAASAAVHFIEPREGFSATPYRDQAGLWTIGFGRRIDDGTAAAVTRDDEEAWLARRVEALIGELRSEIIVPVTDDQLAALASLCYNIGSGACARSELFRMVNSGEPVGEIMREWLSWDHIHLHGELIVSPGLSRRRAQEVGLYFFGTSDLR